MLMSLLLVSMAVKGMAMGYDCERDVPPNCVNNPRINVLKDSNDYRVTLCSDNQCIPENPDGMSNWIECQDVCDACRLLPGQNGKIMRPYNILSSSTKTSVDCSDDRQCEVEVDAFLDNYCASATFTNTVTTTHMITTTITSTQPATTVTQHQTVTSTSTTTSTLTVAETRITTTSITVSPSCSPSPPSQCSQTCPPSPPSQHSESATTNAILYDDTKTTQIPMLALGALSGLSVVLLVVVTAGWVWTCSNMRKRAGTKIRSGEIT